MDITKSSLDSEQDSRRFPRELSRSLKTRLHSRMMAAAYKYRLMTSEEEGGGGKGYNVEVSVPSCKPCFP